MTPAFFVPRADGTHLQAVEAERAYGRIREEAEQGVPARDGRVFRLRFVHSEYRDELVAEVGQLDPYGYKRRVAAIIEFPDHFWVCTSAPNHIVGREAQHEVGEGVDYLDDYPPSDLVL